MTIDTAAPSAPTISSIPENSGGVINAVEASDGTPVVVSLTGSEAAAGDMLTVAWGGQAVSYTLLAADIAGASATVTVPLATIEAQGQGAFAVTARLTDAAGNAGPSSAATPVTVDTSAPTAPVIGSVTDDVALDDVAQVTGINASEASNGTPVTVGLAGTGTAEAGSTN